MKKPVAYLLIVLALVMLYLGISKGMPPPAITGVGFILIALVFLKERN